MFNFSINGSGGLLLTYIAGDEGMLSTYILVTNIFCVIGAI